MAYFADLTNVIRSYMTVKPPAFRGRLIGSSATSSPLDQGRMTVSTCRFDMGLIFCLETSCHTPTRQDIPLKWRWGKLRGDDAISIGWDTTFSSTLCSFGPMGVELTGTMEDTEVNDALLDEFAASHSLEASCQRAGTVAKLGKELYVHLANQFGGTPDRRTQMGNFWKLDGRDPIGFDYAAGDGVATWALWEKQVEALSRPFNSEGDSLEFMRSLESRVTRTVYRMTKRGVKIDEGRLDEILHILQDRITEARKALPDGFNINSSKEIRALMEKAGRTDWPMTAPSKTFPEGQPQFNEAYLSSVPEGAPILALRKWENMRNTFALPMKETHLWHGRVHATFTQMANDDYGTVTGRFSSSQPNLQQVPKRDKEKAKLIRSMFVPDDGLDWWDADLSQCEPRLLAHYSGSKVLTEGYLSNPPVDAHTAVANAASIDRESGKRLNQTLITGGGRKKIIAMLGERGSAIYDAYFEAMPEVKKLQTQAANRMKARGYVISLLGRLARLEHSDKAYLAINRLLQCGNADIVKYAMVNIDDYFESRGDECAMLNTVHDALGFQADRYNNDHIEQMNEALRLMTDFGPDRGVYLSVPMVADFGIGRNWAEATFPTEKMSFGD